MLFSQVLGQDKIKKQLTDTFQHGRTAHAQILIGSEGVGGLPLALAYAQYLQCEAPTATDACGHCSACYKTNKLIHPDLHFVYPTIGTGKISTDYIKEWRAALAENPYLNLAQWLQILGAENQQGNINKNECLEIVKKFSLTKSEGKYKILILWLPEYLGKEGNRLLKLIEEPEPNTVFLLVAEQAEKILNTIRSRCQSIQIPKLSDNDIIQYLVQKEAVLPARAATVAYLSNGNLNAAQHLHKDVEEDVLSQLWYEWLQLCKTSNGLKWAKWVEKISTADEATGKKLGRKEQVLCLQYGLHYWRELTAYKVHGNFQKVRLDAQEFPYLQQFAYLKFGKIQEISDMMNDLIFHIERNASPKPLFLSASIRMSKALNE
jgi:DNA polymerase III subunit delta'